MQEMCRWRDRSGFGKLTPNGIGLGEGGASRLKSFNPPQNLIKRTNDEYSR